MIRAASSFRRGISGLVLVLAAASCRFRYDDVAALSSGEGSLGGAAGTASAGTSVSGGMGGNAASTNAGVGAEAAGGGQDAPCEPSAGEALATWYANGNVANGVACSPLAASAEGVVGYSAGVSGLAWQFRSEQVSPAGDPDFISIAAVRPVSFTAISIDTVVRQVSFNAYPGSNRMIFADDFGELGFASVRVALYLHENHSVYFRIQTAAQDASQEAFCSFGPLAQDLWTRLTGTWDGSELACYLDGQLVETKALALVGPIELTGSLIGRNFPGDIDGLRLLTRPLSLDEVSAGWP